jgi:hypothetical protein
MSGKANTKATAKTVFQATVKTEPLISDSTCQPVDEVPKKPDSIETILAKRRAEKMLEKPVPTNSDTTSPDGSFQPSVAKLNTLEVRMKQLKENAELLPMYQSLSDNSYITPTSSPLKLLSLKTTSVQINEWYVEDGKPGEETTVCATVCNVYGLKDELLGSKTLPNGDFFYWPGRIFYPNQVTNIMNSANVTTGSEFLKAANGKPLIIYSRFSETLPDTLLKFDESIEYLKQFIEGATDEASSGNPKKTFHITVQRKPLNEMQVDALVVISSRIYRSA